ncbi:MAG: TGS domain-containing protein [Candidatus Marinimicrobia bacterium]|nr:TGS domain-containing protein [Candidatus Neomarinimicrobiota bacterium]
MPTNLPPEAIEAEKRYRAAKTTAEKITCLEEFISAIPKHKGTDKLRANLRKRLSKLKSDTQKRQKVSQQYSAFHIESEGAGQAVVVGPANVGKSSLVTALTHAAPKVSEVPFTTWVPTPGMMPVENIHVKLIDTPPLNRDYVEPELIELIRRSDLILLVVDLQADPVEQFKNTLALLKDHRIVPYWLKDHYTKQSRVTLIPLIGLVNKCDSKNYDDDFEICCELLKGARSLLPVSATTGRNIENIKQVVFDKLEIIRVYSKPPGKPADLKKPFVLKKGSTVADFAYKIHSDFFEKLKSVRVWGSAVYDGQMVGQDHVLQDGDVVELSI